MAKLFGFTLDGSKYDRGLFNRSETVLLQSQYFSDDKHAICDTGFIFPMWAYCMSYLTQSTF